LLADAINMHATPEEAARELLETVPIVTREIRFEMRSQRLAGLTVPQFRALAFIDRNSGSSLLEVANHMGLTPPSTSRLVDGLIARGMITREDHPADRRRLKLTVTHCGQEILETSRRSTLACLAKRLSSINASDRETIVKAMKVLQPMFTSDAQPRKLMK